MITSSIKRSFLISLLRFSFVGALLFSVTVSANAQTIYKVGSTGGDYTTISAAYAACSTSTNYIIEIMPNYGTIEVALGGITLGSNTATSITIRPQAGNNSFVISTSITGAIFEINAASNVTIDGRPGGTGTTGFLTLENKNATVGVNGMYVIRFSSGATKNTVQYCTIKGANPNTGAANAGVICFKADATNQNAVDNCTIGASTTKPAIAITSVFSDLGAGSNSNTTISNCNIVDFTSKGIWMMGVANTGWSITGNSFYQSTTFTPANSIEMINISSGGNHTISNNYLGGQASACGGSPYTLGGYPFKGIYFSSSSSGTTNTIAGNTIQNFTISGSNNTSIYGFAGIYLRGSGTFICGGSTSAGNTIGSLSTASSISYTSSATGGSAGFSAIVDSALTATTISYNNIGGIQINTNLAAAVSDMIMVSAGTATVNNNTIGSIPALITHTNIGTLTLINNTTNIFTVTNNTIQGISLTNAGGTNTFYGIKNSGNGAYTCSLNTITNISSINNGLVNIFTYSALGGSGTFQSNTVHTISLTNTGTTGGLNVFNITSSAPATIDNNTIGNTSSATNISVAANKLCNVIVNGGGGTFTVTNNTIQNIYLSTAGTSNGFIGIGVTAGYSVFNCTRNKIINITSATACTIGYGVIYCNTVATGLTVSNNTVSTIAFTNSTVATINNGIYLGGTSNYGGVANANMITGLSNNSTITGGKLIGIEMANGSWNVENNVILLDNAGGSSIIPITGIDLASTGTTNNIYSNTVKISGTQTGASGSIACGGNTNLGTYTVKNNIFQNIRSGGTGIYYAEYYPNLSTTMSTSYNYVESSTPATIARKSTGTYTSTTWPTASPSSVIGTTTLDAAGRVTSAPFAGAGKGSAPPPVGTDYSGANRSGTAPWMGAYEGVEILTSAISPTTMCAGASVSVGYTLNGTLSPSFDVQLSSATGSFSTPVTLISGSTSNPIFVTIPTTTTTGTGYRIRVFSSAPFVTLADNGTNLTINAVLTPSITLTPSPTTICTGDNVTFTANPTNGGTSPFYQWQKNGTLISGVTGASYTTNTASSSDAFTVTLTSSAACASTAPVISAPVSITVNALPTISTTAAFSICTTVNSSSLAATVGGSATGVTWTTSGSGTFSNANIVNPTYTFTAAEKAAGQVIVTATTTGSPCTAAASSSTTITFTPAPVVPATTPPTICSDNPTNIPLSSSPAATSYTWTRAVVTGITPATGSGTTSIIAETLTNTTASPVTVIYSVRPIMGACIGNPTNISQVVNPLAVLSTSGTVSICSGSSTNITLSSTPAATSYTWTRALVTGITPTTGSGTTSIIAETLTNTTASPVTVIYTATPTTGACTGNSVSISQTVNPLPVLSTPGTIAICSSSSTTIPLSSTPAATSYTWTRALVTGITPTTGSGTTSVISETLTNTTASPITVIYTATPTTAACTGNTLSISQTVNPTLVPSVTVTASATAICAGTAVAFTASPVNGGTTPSYQWKKNGTTITGATNASYTTTAILNNDAFTIAFTSNATCASTTPVTSSPAITITVNPLITPSVIITASATTICTGTIVSFTPAPTNGGTSPSYQWQKNGIGIGGASNATYSTSSIVTGDIFTVTLTSNAACASTTPVTSNQVTMTVNTVITPTVTVVASATTVCAGTAVTFTATPTNGGTTPTYQWTKNSAPITGATNNIYSAATPANNDAFNVVLTSNDPCASPVTATLATPITITVNPTLVPSVAVTASATTICAGTAVAFTASPVNGGTTPAYQWKKNGTTITGATNVSYTTVPILTSDAFTVTLTSNATCASPTSVTSSAASVTVNPLPILVATPSSGTICSGSITNIVLSCSITGSTFSWSTPVSSPASAVTGGSLGSTTALSINQTLTNATASAASLNYSITPTSPSGCIGSVAAATLIVNPTLTTSVTISTPATTICAGTTATFTATPVNGGAAPAYQWFVGSTPVGSNSPTFTSTTLANGDAIKCTMTSNATCPSPTTATSLPITMTVNPVLTPSVTVTASAATICAGASVTFTATPANGGSSPSYQWQNNGTAISGATNAAYSTSTAITSDKYTVTLVSNATCATTTPVTSSPATSITVNPLVSPSVTISATTTAICPGTAVTFTAVPANGGTSPSYQWQKNSVTILGATNSNYSTTAAANSDKYLVVLTSTAACPTASTATSAAITMTVNSTLIPSVTISTPATTICAGTAATFTATPANGGSTPSYQWFVGSSTVGSNSPTFTSTTLANGDAIKCTVTSNASCASPTTATSLPITMTVNPVLTPSVTVTTSAATICAGASVTFTATPANGGPSPTYQWQKNAITIAGATNATYSTTTALTSDGFTVTLTSNATCATTAPVTSSPATSITVNPLVTPSVTISATATTICLGAAVTFTAAPTNGGTSPSYQWQKNSTTIPGATNSNYSTTAAANNDKYLVVLTSTVTCPTATTATSTAITITVNSILIPSVTISTPATTICAGAAATFTATPVNGGATPSYQWFIGSTAVGSNSPTFTSTTLANSDVIKCTMTSNASCASPTTATSLPITMTVNPVLTPSVTVTASAATICAGAAVTFTAAPVNGGTSPAYQWQKNTTIIAGATNATYSTTTALTSDGFTVTLVSNATCATTAPVTSTSVTIVVNTPPTAVAGTDISACTTGGTISLNGTVSNAASSQWASPGTGVFSNTTSLTATYTPSAADKASGQTKIILRAIAAPCPTGTDTLVITYTAAPTISAGGDQSYCANISFFTLNGSGASGTWSGGSGTYAPNASTANPVYTPTAAEITTGSLTLTYTSLPGLCPIVSDPVNYTFKPLATVNTVAPITICSGTSTNIALASTPTGATFTWTASPVSGTVTGATSGSGSSISQNLTVASGSGTVNYSVTPTLNGCTGTARTIAVTVSIPVISPATLNPATFGASYTAQTFSVTNMTSPSWTSTASIPGMTVSSGGILSGTPTAANTYSFDVTAKQGLCTATQNYSFIVSLSSTTWNGTSWSNGQPNATTSAIINGNYTTGNTETFTANTITVNTGSTFTITGTATVTTGGLTNNGTINQQCSSGLNISGSTTGNAATIVQPVINPSTLNNGTITIAYNQATPFSTSFGNAQVFTAAGLPSGLSMTTNAGVSQLSGIPTVAGTYTIVVTAADGSACFVNTQMTLKILNLTNPKLKFPHPTFVKTYGIDTSFAISATSLSGAPITYTISPATGCVTYNNNTVKISCVPATDIWLIASQAYTAQYQAAVDSVKIIVDKATPVATLLTLPGMILTKNVLFDYQLPVNYTGTATYDQISGQQVATIDAAGTITPLTTGTFEINLQLTGTSNFFSLDTTFTFTVFDQYQKPTAVPDTVILIRNDGTIIDGSINLLQNDFGTTGHLRVNLTDIDVVNAGNQDIFYDPSIGTFELNQQTGVLTIHPSRGLLGTARIGYTITDSNGVTSDVAYVTIEIRNTQAVPDLKANEVMTPNHDTKNDVLFIGYTDVSMNNEITIMDAASNIIYETSNYQNDWTGINNKGELVEAGVYFFVFAETEGLSRQLKGYIEIIR